MATPRWAPGTLYLPGALVQPLTQQVATLNPPDDPGFESGTLADWSYTPVGGTAVASVQNQYVDTGTYAFYWPGGSGGGSEGGIECELINDERVNVTAGTTSITASCRIMYNPTSSPNGSQGRVRIHWFDGGGVEIGSPSEGNLIKGRGNNRRWVTSTVSAVAPVGAVTAAIGAWLTTVSGGVYADTFQWNYIQELLPGLIYRAVQAGPGTSDNVEPAWPQTLGVTVVDNTVTWEAVQANRVTWQASPIMESGATEPTFPTSVGQRVTDNNITWEAVNRRIEDENCPNSKEVVIVASHVFATDDDIVRFCAVANPKDWTSSRNAGYLATGLQSANAGRMSVLNQYRGNVAAFNPSVFQAWQADPNPELMVLMDQLPGIGSKFQRAAQPVVNDLFFLAAIGVRSVGIAGGTTHLQGGDVGEAIDPIVKPAVATALANDKMPISAFWPGAGQYWLTFANYPPSELSIAGDFPDVWGTGQDADYQYTSSGGISPKTFTITGGALPPGISLTTSGRVIGSSSTLGPYSWEVTVTDYNGDTASLDDGTEIMAAPVITGAAPDGGLHLNYAGYTYGATGGTPPYVFSNPGGGLPPGIGALDAGGTIPSGSPPTQAGFFSPTISVIDANNLVGNLVDDIAVGTGIILLKNTAAPTTGDWMYSLSNSWPGGFTSETLLQGMTHVISTDTHHIFYKPTSNPVRCGIDGTGFAASTGTANSGVGGDRQGGRNPGTGTIILPQGGGTAATRSTDGGASFAPCGFSGINNALCIPYLSGYRWIGTKSADQQYYVSDDDGVSSVLFGAYSSSSSALALCSDGFDDISVGFIGMSTSFPYSPKIFLFNGASLVNDTPVGVTGQAFIGVKCGVIAGARYVYAWTDSGQLWSRNMTTNVWTLTTDQPDGVPAGVAFSATHVQMAVHKDNPLDNEGRIYEINPDGTLTQVRLDVMPDTSTYRAISACRY